MTDEEIIEQARKILKRRVRRSSQLSSPHSVRQWLSIEIGSMGHEVFHVTFLDSQHRVIHHEALFHGTIDGASVYPRRVVEECFRHGAAAVIVAHNHPSQVAEPSSADKRITERLQSALALIDVRMLDHFIVTGDEYYSFAEHGMI